MPLFTLPESAQENILARMKACADFVFYTAEDLPEARKLSRGMDFAKAHPLRFLLDTYFEYADAVKRIDELLVFYRAELSNPENKKNKEYLADQLYHLQQLKKQYKKRIEALKKKWNDLRSHVDSIYRTQRDGFLAFWFFDPKVLAHVPRICLPENQGDAPNQGEFLSSEPLLVREQEQEKHARLLGMLETEYPKIHTSMMRNRGDWWTSPSESASASREKAHPQHILLFAYLLKNYPRETKPVLDVLAFFAMGEGGLMKGGSSDTFSPEMQVKKEAFIQLSRAALFVLKAENNPGYFYAAHQTQRDLDPRFPQFGVDDFRQIGHPLVPARVLPPPPASLPPFFPPLISSSRSPNRSPSAAFPSSGTSAPAGKKVEEDLKASDSPAILEEFAQKLERLEEEQHTFMVDMRTEQQAFMTEVRAKRHVSGAQLHEAEHSLRPSMPQSTLKTFQDNPRALFDHMEAAVLSHRAEEISKLREHLRANAFHYHDLEASHLERRAIYRDACRDLNDPLFLQQRDESEDRIVLPPLTEINKKLWARLNGDLGRLQYETRDVLCADVLLTPSAVAGASWMVSKDTIAQQNTSTARLVADTVMDFIETLSPLSLEMQHVLSNNMDSPELVKFFLQIRAQTEAQVAIEALQKARKYRRLYQTALTDRNTSPQVKGIKDNLSDLLKLIKSLQSALALLSDEKVTSISRMEWSYVTQCKKIQKAISVKDISAVHAFFVLCKNTLGLTDQTTEAEATDRLEENIGAVESALNGLRDCTILKDALKKPRVHAVEDGESSSINIGNPQNYNSIPMESLSSAQQAREQLRDFFDQQQQPNDAGNQNDYRGKMAIIYGDKAYRQLRTVLYQYKRAMRAASLDALVAVERMEAANKAQLGGDVANPEDVVVNVGGVVSRRLGGPSHLARPAWTVAQTIRASSSPAASSSSSVADETLRTTIHDELLRCDVPIPEEFTQAELHHAQALAELACLMVPRLMQAKRNAIANSVKDAFTQEERMTIIPTLQCLQHHIHQLDQLVKTPLWQRNLCHKRRDTCINFANDFEQIAERIQLLVWYFTHHPKEYKSATGHAQIKSVMESLRKMLAFLMDHELFNLLFHFDFNEESAEAEMKTSPLRSLYNIVSVMLQLGLSCHELSLHDKKNEAHVVKYLASIGLIKEETQKLQVFLTVLGISVIGLWDLTVLSGIIATPILWKTHILPILASTLSAKAAAVSAVVLCAGCGVCAACVTKHYLKDLHHKRRDGEFTRIVPHVLTSTTIESMASSLFLESEQRRPTSVAMGGRADVPSSSGNVRRLSASGIFGSPVSVVTVDPDIAHDPSGCETYFSWLWQCCR